MITIGFSPQERQILSDLLRGLPEHYSADNDYIQAAYKLLTNQVRESKFIGEHCRQTIHAILFEKYEEYPAAALSLAHAPLARNMIAWAKENYPQLKTPLPERWCPHCGQGCD